MTVGGGGTREVVISAERYLSEREEGLEGLQEREGGEAVADEGVVLGALGSEVEAGREDKVTRICRDQCGCTHPRPETVHSP